MNHDERSNQMITAMDIGKEEKTIRIEPIENPVPARTPKTRPTRRTVPRKEPVKAPTRKPAPVKR